MPGALRSPSLRLAHDTRRAPSRPAVRSSSTNVLTTVVAITICIVLGGCNVASGRSRTQITADLQGSNSGPTPASPGSKVLLAKWAGCADWDDQTEPRTRYRHLRVFPPNPSAVERGPVRGLSASVSGKRLAYLRSLPEPPRRLSKEDEEFKELFGADPRGTYQELVVADTTTWRKVVLAVFSHHPELHAEAGTGPPVIGEPPVTLTWWSGDHILYVRHSGVQRFDVRTGSYQKSKALSALDISDARSSPEGAPLALEVVDRGRDVACLIDPMTGRRLWTASRTATVPCYSPDGAKLAWIEKTGTASSWRTVIAVKSLAAGTVQRYTPRSELLRSSYSSMWWVRDRETVVLVQMVYPEGQKEGLKPFDVGVWRVGTDHIRRARLRTDGCDMFTPL